MKLFSKSFDLALALSGRQPEKKLGKQRSVFPGRRRTEKVASRKLGNKARFCPLSRLAATASRLLALSVTAAAVPAPPKGEPSRQLTRGLQKAKSRLPLWGRCPPKEGGEGQPQVAPGLERGKGSSIEKSQVLCGFQNLTQGSRVPHSCPCFPALLTLGASLKTQVLCGFWPLLTLWNIQVDPMPARGGFPPLSLLQLMGKCL